MHTFPRTHEIEVPEILGQFNRFVDDAFLVFVVTQFNIAGQRKFLTERMTFKPVVAQHPAQIGVIGKIDAEHVPNFALEPVGRIVYADN